MACRCKPILITTIAYLPALAAYLRSTAPAALLSANTECNLVALWARDRVGSVTLIAVSERVMIGSQYQNKSRHRDGRKKWGWLHKWRWRYLAPLMREFYGRADQIIAISEAVAMDLAQFTGIDRARDFSVASAMRCYRTLLFDHARASAGRSSSNPQ